MEFPLLGRVVALAETRQLEDLAAMLAAEGADVDRVPMVAILDAPDPAPVLAWLRGLVADEYKYLAFMTGEGVRRLLAAADRAGFQPEAVAALGRATTVTRGPKPGQAFKEVGLKPTHVAEAPTTAGLLATLLREPLAGATVGVQLHGQDDNPPLADGLAAAGAAVRVVKPYQYAAATDAARVADLITRMAGGGVDLLVITSTPQVQRLAEVAAAHKLTDQLKRGYEQTCVAAVGPIAADTLREHGARVDIMPGRGWQMKNLVQHIKRELDAKRPR